MSFQIVYQSEENDPNALHWLFHAEARSMEAAGIAVGTAPSAMAKRLLYRGTIIKEGCYPDDSRYIHDEKIYFNYLYRPRWYPVIEDLTIPTFFVDDLDDTTIRQIKNRGWEKVFIKDHAKSCYDDDPQKPVWPITDLKEIKTSIREMGRKSGFSIRRYMNPSCFENERRYWVMNGKIHHSSGIIPSIVREAATRLNRLGGLIYNIDATPELIVEINSGESSDRKTDNTEQDFASWISKAFN